MSNIQSLMDYVAENYDDLASSVGKTLRITDEEAKELMAETLVRVANRNFDLSNPAGLFVVMCRRVRLDDLRSNSKDPHVELKYDVGVTDEARDFEEAEMLASAMGQLEHKHRTVLADRLNGLQYSEIASKIGLSPESARRRYHEAVARIKELLEV